MYETNSVGTHTRVHALIWCMVLAAAAPFPAFAQQIFDFKIGNVDAATAVREFGTQSQTQILASATVLEGRSLNAVSGPLSADQALAQLLSGTGLTYHYVADRTVAVSPVSATGPQSAQPKPSAAGPADEAPSNNSSQLEEITVTAQKRTENIMRVPIAIAAFSSDALKSSGVQDIQGLQFATPAVVYTNTGAFSQPYIRGVGSRLLLNGLDPSVATYLDGRYISRQSAVNFDLADIERVEVLKGPQGVLFGRNSSAGAIRVITKDVAKDFEGYVDAGYGDYNQYIVSGAVNIPLTQTLGLRLSGETIDHDGYAKNIIAAGRRDWSDKDSQSVRGKLKWEPDDAFTALLSAGYATHKDQSGGAEVALGVLPLDTGIARGGLTGLSSYQVATAVTAPNHIEDFSPELDLTLRLAPFDVKSITTYAAINNTLAFDGDGTSAVLVDALIYEKANTFSQEFNLTSNSDGPLTWLAGAYLFRDNTGYDTILNGVTFQGLQDVRTKSESGFGQVTWKVVGPFSLTAGGRYSRDTKDFTLSTSPHSNPAGSVTLLNAGAATFTKFTPAFTAQYDFDESTLYAKYSQGFKSGGFNYPATIGSNVLQPEVLNMYETGYKGRLADGAVSVTLAAYYYDYKNLQVTRAAAAGTALVTTTNAGAAKLYGLDADLAWRVTSNFSLSGGLSAEHSKYLDYALAGAFEYKAVATPATPLPGMATVGFDANGHSLLRAPNISAYASANYDFPIHSGSIPVTVSYAYKGAFDFDFVVDPTSNVLHQSGYSLVNARVGYLHSAGHWSAGVWGNNLTNTKYFNDVVASGTGIRGSYAEPLTFGADLKYIF